MRFCYGDRVRRDTVKSAGRRFTPRRKARKDELKENISPASWRLCVRLMSSGRKHPNLNRTWNRRAQRFLATFASFCKINPPLNSQPSSLRINKADQAAKFQGAVQSAIRRCHFEAENCNPSCRAAICLSRENHKLHRKLRMQS